VLDLDDLRAFKLVAVMRSFSSAAQALSLPRSTVSRNVARLERELGARLFQRTTREVALTPTGDALLQRCIGLLASLEDAVDQVRNTTSIPHGLLRVTTGVGFGVNVLAQELPEFLVRYPGVTVSLDLSTEKKDLVADADVAIRLGPMPDSGLVSARLRTMTRHLCVSPAYLERRGKPESLEELVDHDIVEMPNAVGRPRIWTFTKDGETKSFELTPRICVNEALAVHRLVTNGAGVGIISGYICQPAFASGQLVPLFPGWSIPPVDVNIVFASKRELSPNVRAFVDFMKERLGTPNDDGPQSR
jgi:DNA-binding transcriptional LysR family regulator